RRDPVERGAGLVLRHGGRCKQQKRNEAAHAGLLEGNRTRLPRVMGTGKRVSVTVRRIAMIPRNCAVRALTPLNIAVWHAT
ncbi:hypothetical protein ACE4Z6_27335, partial [Salmonella enterica]|uniref:hypothetical protein n=1 Tax=Salmonella enterica TaxID=28901 RepID=UPI003D295BA4